MQRHQCPYPEGATLTERTEEQHQEPSKKSHGLNRRTAAIIALACIGVAAVLVAATRDASIAGAHGTTATPNTAPILPVNEPMILFSCSGEEPVSDQL